MHNPLCLQALYCVHDHHVQDEVLIAGFGRRGHAVGDIPGVRFKVSCARAYDTCCMWTKFIFSYMKTSDASAHVVIGAQFRAFCCGVLGTHCLVHDVWPLKLHFPGITLLALDIDSAVFCSGLHVDPKSSLASQVVKVAGVSLWALFREKKEKPRN